MVHPTPAPEVPLGLLEQLLDGPVLRPDRIAAGRRRVAGRPIDARVLADALVAEAWRGTRRRGEEGTAAVLVGG